MSDIIIDSDSGKFKAGDGQDLNLYHNGTNSFIENETGILYVTNKASANMVLGTSNSARLTIESDGTIVTSGAFQPGGNVTAGGNLALSATNTLFLDGNVGHTFITEYAANKMQLQAGGQGSVILDGTNSGEVRMGVGTSSPDNNVHIVTTSSETGMIIQSNLGGTGSAIGGRVILSLGARNNSGSGQADSQSGDTLGQIMFEGQGTDYSYQGGNIKTIVTTGDGNDNRSNQGTAMTFETIAVGSVSPSEAMRITSSGLIKGKTDASHSSTTVDGDFSGASFYADGGDMVMGRAFFVGQNAGGTKLLGFNNEGTGGSSCLVLHNYTDSASHTRFYHGGNVEIMDGDLKVASGHGIDFSAHGNETGMSSELLDDYEEGLYSVAITGATSGSWTLHSDHNQLAYTKIGRMVTVIGKYETSSGSGSGSLRFSLPFTPAQLGNSGGVAAGSISVNRVGSGNNITSSMTAIAFENLKFIYVQVHNEDASNDESYLNASDIDGAFEGQIGITYFTT